MHTRVIAWHMHAGARWPIRLCLNRVAAIERCGLTQGLLLRSLQRTAASQGLSAGYRAREIAPAASASLWQRSEIISRLVLVSVAQVQRVPHNGDGQWGPLDHLFPHDRHGQSEGAPAWGLQHCRYECPRHHGRRVDHDEPRLQHIGRATPAPSGAAAAEAALAQGHEGTRA